MTDYHTFKINGFVYYCFQDSAESLLRSALQGKGYTKGMQNGLTVLPSHSIKIEDNLRRVMYVTDQVNSFNII